MNDNLKKFAEKVSNDPKLQEKLKSIKSNDDESIDKLIAIAKEEGFELSKEDIDNEPLELSAEEMNSIVGAGGCGCTLFGHGAGSDLFCTCVMKGTGYVQGYGGLSSQGGCLCPGVGVGATRRH